MYRERNKHDISVDGLYQSPESRWHGIQRLHDKRKGEWVQELQVDGAQVKSPQKEKFVFNMKKTPLKTSLRPGRSQQEKKKKEKTFEQL